MASGWLRALLRRFGIGERRWIPPRPEREAHTELVDARDAAPASAAATDLDLTVLNTRLREA